MSKADEVPQHTPRLYQRHPKPFETARDEASALLARTHALVTFQRAGARNRKERLQIDRLLHDLAGVMRRFRAPGLRP